MKEVIDAINDPDKIVIAQTAPSIRVSLSEMFGMPIQNETGKMVAALRRLGFDKILDTDFGADLTIMEEGTELIDRIKNKGVLPLMSSCCPAWIRFAENSYPDIIPHIGTCKSPMQMVGVVIKTYYAEKHNIPPEKIVSVAIMPCMVKKLEAKRPEMQDSGYRDVDIVITTKELGQMIRDAGIDFKNLPDEEFDPILGEGSGAGAIFGTTGGVMEAALRFVADRLEGKDLEKIDYHEVRGLEGIREATVNIAGMDINLAIIDGLPNTKQIVEEILAGKSKYHFIEVMCCPGGCIGGSGQPKAESQDSIKMRRQALFNEDSKLKIRKPHLNPDIIRIYEEYLEHPGSDKAHKLLHTRYSPKQP